MRSLALGSSIVYAAPAMRHSSLARPTARFDKLLMTAVLLLASGCAPKLGDECENAFECSANNTRVCDETQPGGYCTIPDCEPESCGDEGYCVRFNPQQPRLSRDWCMAKCSNNDDCGRKSYVCRGADDLNATRGAFAEVLDDKKSGKFCVVRE
jgi:hypothetical protein